MNAKRFTAAVFFLFMILGVMRVEAQDDFTPQPPPIISPPVWHDEGLAIGYQRVDVTIKEQVATTHVDQLFVNNNERLLEGTYLFPLPHGAAVSQLTMWINGEPIEAKILEKEEARDIYDTIVRQLRDPALLEYVGTSAIQANVFPIPPHEERRVEIEYSQVLPMENGLVHYIYPQSTKLYTNVPLDSQSIRVEVASNEPIQAIYSPSHPVAISRDGDQRATVGFEADQVTADEDFELYYSLSAQAIGLNLLSYREPGEDGFFMLLVAPNVEAQDVVAKDVILVLDTSGSMEGQKLQQAKDAAVYIVDHLNPEDRFSIVAFSTGVRRYAANLLQSMEAGDFESFIHSLDAVGGTNISAALLEAAGQADPERPTTIIFVTDGLATEGISDTGLLLDAVGGAMPANARIFAFGVGNDVDPDLLDNLAQNHRGTTTYVRPGQAVDEAVSGFYAMVSSPVLSNISLDYDGIVVEQTYPQTMPDLFAGTQLVLVGRYRAGGPATITLSGDVNGEPQQFVYRDNFFRTGGGDDFIPRLWATRATGHLLRQIRLYGENDELVQSVVNLSIRYGIITPYTSYLIEEDDIFSQTGRSAIVDGEMQPPGGADNFALESAVEEAAIQSDLAEAEAPLRLVQPTAAPGMAGKAGGDVQPLVEFAGNKTFVWRDGMWIDTMFEEDRYLLQEVGFAGDAYFDLLSAAPEIGQYLALGRQVLLVHDDKAYLIVAAEAAANATPTAALSDDHPDQPAADVTPAAALSDDQPDQPAADVTPAAALSDDQPDQLAADVAPEVIGDGTQAAPVPDAGAAASQNAPCTALLAFPALLGTAAAVTWFGRRRVTS